MTEEEFDEKMVDSIQQRNPHLLPQEPIHPWRWRFLAAWIIIFTALAFIAIRSGRENSSDINRTVIVLKRSNAQLRQSKASIVQLQRTNCGLKQFLLAARAARLRAARIENGAQKASDFEAAKGYKRLASTFTGVGVNCKLNRLSKNK